MIEFSFQVHSNPLVGEVLTLEQHLMEGSYGFVFDLQKQQQESHGRNKQSGLPQSSRVFIDKLVRTVRLKAAACLERAHNEVDLQYAMQTLNLPTVEDLQGFVEIHNLGKQQAAAMAVSASSNVAGEKAARRGVRRERWWGRIFVCVYRRLSLLRLPRRVASSPVS